MLNSCTKGKVGEREVIALLHQYWPGASRNLEQCLGESTSDVIGVKGVHFQIKRTEALRTWDALRQAEEEAKDLDLPVLVFRRNRSKWYACLELEELLPLLALKDL